MACLDAHLYEIEYKLSFIKAHGMTQCDQSYYHKNHCLAHTNMTTF
jgi:hypothetical protein